MAVYPVAKPTTVVAISGKTTTKNIHKIEKIPGREGEIQKERRVLARLDLPLILCMRNFGGETPHAQSPESVYWTLNKSSAGSFGLKSLV